MKIALNPAELRLIVDALDDKRQFQLQSGRAEQGGYARVLLLQTSVFSPRCKEEERGRRWKSGSNQ
jgi:hypothetical protein